MATIFEQILDTNTIDVEDDGSLEKLIAAAGDVEKLIRGFKLAPAVALLVAMDPAVDPGEPMLDEVQTVVKKHWPTLRRRYVEMPVALLRAVLTDALSRAGKDDAIGSILWLTGASYAPFAPLTAEASVWSNLLPEWGAKADSSAANAWASPNTTPTSVPAPNLPVPSFRAVTIKESWLAPRLNAAASLMNESPEGVEANTEYIVSSYRAEQAGAAWGAQFGKTAATAIAEGMRSAIQESLKSADFGPLVNSVAEALGAASRAGSEGLAPLHAVELRSRVLMWDRAHYSDSLQRGYRELPTELAILAMAADLARIVPPMSPRSIDALLWESARDVVGDAVTSIPDLAAALAKHRSDASSLLERSGEPESEQRMTLLQFFRQVLDHAGNIEGTRLRVGIEEDRQIPLADLARWMFRDMRAERIAPRPRKRR